MTYHAKVIAAGKIVIPADLRRESGGQDRDTLILNKDESNRLSIMTFEQSCVSRSGARGPIRGYDVEGTRFDLDDALAAGRLRASTRAIGASLGDRACLALGQRHGLPVFTGDRRLAGVDPALGIDARLIR